MNAVGTFGGHEMGGRNTSVYQVSLCKAMRYLDYGFVADLYDKRFCFKFETLLGLLCTDSGTCVL